MVFAIENINSKKTKVFPVKQGMTSLLVLLLFMNNIAKAEDLKIVDSRIGNSILITADEIIYNDNIQVVNAYGNVEIIKDNSIIWADEISYNKTQDLVMAKGNITYRSEDGSVSYGSAMEFNNNMKTGFIKSPQGRMADDSRIAASIGKRETPTITILENVVYSPCDVCEGDENPIWQIKAKKVIDNEETMNVSYHNAWIEVYGTPVFWTPYLTHPDPRVERRSGWLPSTIENSSDVGFMLRNYYYWDIQENTDATFELTLVDVIDTPVFGAEIRHLFDKGEVNFSGSITIADEDNALGIKTDTDTLQGHIFIDAKYDINDHWRTGFKIKTVSKDNYFEIYNFDSKDDDILTSTAYLEGFYGDDYLALTGYKFKDLRPNITEEQPDILPFAEYSFKGRDLANINSSWVSQGNILALDQDDVAKELRLYNQSGVEQSYLSTSGISLDISADLYSRIYFIDQEDSDKDDFIAEFMPQLYILTKYPLKKNLKNGATTIFEPIANLIIAPNGANDEDIPLQDSTVLDLAYTNLFSKNRLSGVDRLEDGIRSSYGIKTSILNKGGGYSSLFLGQSYRHRKNDLLFSNDSSFNDKFSDIILELQLKPSNFLNLDYSAIFDKDDLTDKKHEVYFSIGKPKFRLIGSYLYKKEDSENTTNENNQELKVAFTSKLSDYWAISGSSTSELGASGEGLLKAGLNLEYTDECFSLGLYGERDLTNRKGASSATTIMLRLGLKNIGEIEAPALSTGFLFNDD